MKIAFYVFDVLWLDGEDLRERPLRERKAALREALRFGDGVVRWTPYRRAHEGERLLREACRNGWEGLIAKRADSPYVGKRSRDWLKLKCSAEQELVIGGYTAPRGSREDFGALLVGFYDGDVLRYAGKVGTGFDARELRTLGERMASARAPRLPVRRRRPAGARHHLGRARAGRAGRVRRMDARRAPAPPALPRPARRQARARGGARAPGVSWRRFQLPHRGKGVPALVTGPRGAELLCGSRAYRNTFRRRPEGCARYRDIHAHLRPAHGTQRPAHR